MNVRSATTPPLAGAMSALRLMTGYLLRLAHLRAIEALNSSFTENRRPRDLGILLLLAVRGPLSQHEVAAEWAINRTSMVALIDSLEEAGLVRRERNTVDRRSYALQLTDEGRVVTARMLDQVRTAEAELTADLGVRQRRRLKELLGHLIATPPEGMSEVTTSAPFLLTRAHRAVRELGEQAMASLSIEPRHSAALGVLTGIEPCSQQELAETMGISAPSVLDVVAHLVQIGAVARERHATDRRAYVLKVTPAGQELLSKARAAYAVVQQGIDERLGPQGDQELRKLLQILLAQHPPG